MPNEAAIVAVSGGADSIALLHALHTNILPIEWIVATVDHGLRDDSEQDVTFVRQMAARYRLPFVSAKVDVATIARENSVGIEHAARIARYRALADIATTHGARQIVTAHHADDQVETILMRLLRGSGLTGLGGMAFDAPVPHVNADLRLIRPMLTVSRAAILAYCSEHDLSYRHDPTNDDTDILRNRLRHSVLPYLRSTVNSQVDKALLRLAEVAVLEDEFMQRQLVQTVVPHLRVANSRVYLPRMPFANWHPALRRRAIHYVLSVHFPDVVPQYEHILHAVSVADGGKLGAIAQFNGGVQFRVDYDDLVIEAAGAGQPSAAGFPYLLPEGFEATTMAAPGTIEFAQMGWGLHIQLAGNGTQITVPANANFSIRGRVPGDRVRPWGLHGHSQKLKDWMINRKVPQNIRDQVPLLLINSDIVGVLFKNQWELMQSKPISGKSVEMTLIIHKISYL